MLSNVRERGRTTGALNRRVGLEQEFFLVEESGMPSDRADEFLLCCREVTGREGSSPACFAPEFVVGLVEINSPPVYTLAELEREYLNNLRLALRTARSLGIRLYPLGTYPLPLEPAMRDELDYLVQDRTVGPERFVHAGRVMVAGVLDPRPLIFVDECGTHTSLAPIYGYSPKGERLKLSVARNRGKNTTLLASMTLEGMGPSLAVEGSTTAEVFEAYLEHVLLPELGEGRVIIMDSLPAHKPGRVRELI